MDEWLRLSKNFTATIGSEFVSQTRVSISGSGRQTVDLGKWFVQGYEYIVVVVCDTLCTGVSFELTDGYRG